MKNKLVRKKILFILITFVTLCWIIFYSFIHRPSKDLVIFFTYQSNFIVWLYYVFWMIGYLLYKYLDKNKFLSIMNHRGFNHFVGSIITLTTFVAIFILGPFEAFYYTFSSVYVPSDSDIILWQRLFIYYNSFMLHVVIPWLVIYDLVFDYHDVSEPWTNTYFIGIIYVIFYLVGIEINGAINHVYPYTPLDPNAFASESFGMFVAVISPFVGFGIYCGISYLYIRIIKQRSAYHKFKSSRSN